MQITVRGYEERDLPEMVAIWNEVVEDGIAFPQEELLTEESGKAFFAAQNHCDKVLWLYILRPNNVGRCEHICNASYAVSTEACGLRKAGAGLPCHGQNAGLWCDAVQRGGGNQPACPPPVRAAGLYPTGGHSPWDPHERRALRGYLPLLQGAATRPKK